jgi:hypothetical protein
MKYEPRASDSPSIMNEKEAAKWLNLSERTLQKLRLEGGGPAFVELTVRRRGYTMAALEAWVAARQRRSTSDKAA